MGELSKLPNIGKTVEQQLNQAGMVKDSGNNESACMHRLSALEGAIRGMKKTELPEDIKAELKEFYQCHKK